MLTMCRLRCWKRIADAICTFIIGMLRHSLFASMVHGDGQKHDDKSFGERMRLLVGSKVIADALNCFKHDF